ncbi:ParB N-terminal domain-containing protein [Promicromonospora sp. NPDC023987]|uniref:ParB/RepB/Spo0J family partition protein n=1 Tax=Promicromonospora sp. NPDC023987 TaxID=3155360 RepID=UPI0033F0C3CF
MGEQPGALEVALSAITVGVRHRKDVGDLEPLMDSIAKRGLLQPITLTPELVLVCGWRRLEAMRRLGWTHTRPWWRPGLSEGATQVLAEHDENFLQQAYSKSEQATLFRELKSVLQQEAARRRSAHWFTSNRSDEPSERQPDPGGADREGADGPVEADEYGSGSGPGPEELGKSGDAREQAAQLVAGRKSYHALERIGTLMDLAVDPEQPEPVRVLAADAVARIDEGHPLKPEWARIQAALAAHAPDDVSAEHSAGAAGGPRIAQTRSSGPAVSRAVLRAWVMTWRGAAALLDEHDPTVLGPALPEADWHAVSALSRDLTTFLSQADTARHTAGLPTTDADTHSPSGEQPGGGLDLAAPAPEMNMSQPEAGSKLASVIPIGARS